MTGLVNDLKTSVRINIKLIDIIDQMKDSIAYLLENWEPKKDD